MPCDTGKIPPGQAGGVLLQECKHGCWNNEMSNFGGFAFLPPLFSRCPVCNSFCYICMHIIVSSQKLTAQLWGASKIIRLCEEMVELCVCSHKCCHMPVSAAAAYNDIDFCHPSVFHQEPSISILLFSKRNCRQLKSSQGLLGLLLLIYILKNEIKPWEAIVFWSYSF